MRHPAILLLAAALAATAAHAKNDHHGAGCPPGLAKKNNGCLPPGQAKKYGVGDRLPRDVVLVPVPQPVLVTLPAPPRGHRYVRVGADILLLSSARVVVDVVVAR